MRYLGIDTGGTFTDLVEIDQDGRIAFEKSFSTPDNPDRAVFDVLTLRAESQGETLDGALHAAERLVHGTTVSTNALIQRKGAKVGLITTVGFEDTLTIGRGPVGRTGGLPLSQALDFLHTPVPNPLVPKSRIVGIGERITAGGDVLAAPDQTEIEAAIHRLREAGAESLAVCLLWAFRNPRHEQMVRDIVAESAPDLPVSLSSEIAPRLGEFERMVTTVVNAFIGPISERYIQSMQSQLEDRGFARTLQIMKSSGGVTMPGRVGVEAVSVINSGPVGGLIAARHIGRLLGYDNIITADVGGTSFDVGIIGNGVFEEQKTPFIDQGLPVHIPAIKLVTIGAGGGSIAWSDGYRLQVGPQSAGSVPGPVCYGAGGTQPTVTDALVTLGIIDPAGFFGGRRKLDREKALEAIKTGVADPLGLDPMEAAAGIYEVVTAKMGDLIRKATVESGNDPKQFCLLSYGGAGGAHCAAYSAQLGIRKIIIPYAAPVFSAFGCAFSDVLCSHSKSEPVRLSAEPGAFDGINRAFAELRNRVIDDMKVAGFAADELVLGYKLDIRYQGQMNEVTLVWQNDRLTESDAATLREAFEALYENKFGAGTTHAGSTLEIISVRAEAVKESAKPDIAPLFSEEEAAPGTEALPAGRRKVYQHGQGWLEAGIYDFETLRPGQAVRGPAVIERRNTTVWLPPASSAVLDIYGNLEIEPGE